MICSREVPTAHGESCRGNFEGRRYMFDVTPATFQVIISQLHSGPNNSSGASCPAQTTIVTSVFASSPGSGKRFLCRVSKQFVEPQPSITEGVRPDTAAASMASRADVKVTALLIRFLDRIMHAMACGLLLVGFLS